MTEFRGKKRSNENFFWGVDQVLFCPLTLWKSLQWNHCENSMKGRIWLKFKELFLFPPCFQQVAIPWNQLEKRSLKTSIGLPKCCPDFREHSPSKPRLIELVNNSLACNFPLLPTPWFYGVFFCHVIMIYCNVNIGLPTVCWTVKL